MFAASTPFLLDQRQSFEVAQAERVLARARGTWRCSACAGTRGARAAFTSSKAWQTGVDSQQGVCAEVQLCVWAWEGSSVNGV